MASFGIVERSTFEPYSASLEPLGKVVPVLDIMETREVGIDRTEQISRNCGMRLGRNYRDAARGWPSHDRLTYYVKKRITLGRRAYDGLATYQFIASRKPLVKDPLLLDPTERLDPGPEERIPSLKNNLNRFRMDLGMIYCEQSTMRRLALIQNNLVNCGIEETLVTLCLRDTAEINTNGVETLNLDIEFDHQNVPSAVLADSAVQIKEMIREQCMRLVKIDM